MQRLPFTTTTTNEGHRYTVSVAGDVDLETADQLWGAVELAFINGATHVTIDLADTTFMDSTGLSVLVRATNRFGVDAITITDPGPHIQKVFEITGLRKRFDIDLTRTAPERMRART
jgi:anti-anti-sigma factor